MPENTQEETIETYRVALKHINGAIGQLKANHYHIEKEFNGRLNKSLAEIRRLEAKTARIRKKMGMRL